MSEVHVKEGESLDSALKRFKRSCAKAGIVAEVRRRECYESPSVKRRKKSEAGALIALTLTEFGKHTGLSAGTLKAAQSIVQRLIRLHTDLRHFVFPPSMNRTK